MLDEKTRELIAIGASITANCQPCLEYHATKAREFGLNAEDILDAIKVGQQVRRGATAKMDQKIDRMAAGSTEDRAETACGCH